MLDPMQFLGVKQQELGHQRQLMEVMQHMQQQMRQMAIFMCLAMQNFAGRNSTKKIHSGRCRDVEWSVCEGVVQNYGSLVLEQWRVRIGSGGESSNRRYGIEVNFERLLFV